jgi:hypothetical protein
MRPFSGQQDGDMGRGPNLRPMEVKGSSGPFGVTAAAFNAKQFASWSRVTIERNPIAVGVINCKAQKKMSSVDPGVIVAGTHRAPRHKRQWIEMQDHPKVNLFDGINGRNSQVCTDTSHSYTAPKARLDVAAKYPQAHPDHLGVL